MDCGRSLAFVCLRTALNLGVQAGSARSKHPCGTWRGLPADRHFMRLAGHAPRPGSSRPGGSALRTRPGSAKRSCAWSRPARADGRQAHRKPRDPMGRARVKPDFCKVGKTVVPFDIARTRNQDNALYAKTVYARDEPVLMIDSIVEAVEGDKGKGLGSKVSQGKGQISTMMPSRGSSTTAIGTMIREWGGM